MGEGRVITRMRPSLTCVPCKKKKVKCDKQKPTCSQCGRSNTTCYYETISAPASDTGSTRSWDQHRHQTPAVKRQKNVQNNVTGPRSSGTNGNTGALQQLIDPDLQRAASGSNQGGLDHQVGISEEAFSGEDLDMEMMQWQSESGSQARGDHNGQGEVGSGHFFGVGDMHHMEQMASFLDETCPLFSAADLKDMENFYHPLPPPTDFLQDPVVAAATAVPTPPATAGSSRSGSVIYDNSHFASPLPNLSASAERPTYIDQENKNTVSNHTTHPQAQQTQQTQQKQQKQQLQQRASFTASMDTLDFDDKAAKPRRYIPRDSEQHVSTPPGSLHVNNSIGNHVRFLGSPFWACSSSSQKSLGNMLLSSHLSQHQSSQLHQSRQAELSRMMQSLPPKNMCDILLDSFLLGVQPLLPMVHIPTLRNRYDGFWAGYSRTRPTRAGSTPPIPDIMPALKEDPSFAPLLWSVLYCGAVAAPPNLLSRASFKVSDRWTLLSRLRAYVNQALHLCGQAKFPTLNGLVASLLAQWCDPSVDQIIDMPPFIVQCVQAARALGLHRETALAALPETEAQVGRMVWQHVMELEILATVGSGTCLAYLSHEDSDMPPPLRISDITPGTESELCSSSSRILAAGRMEMIRIMRRIIKVCYSSSSSSHTADTLSSTSLTKDDIKKLSSEIESFEIIMDGLVNLLNVRGQPEHGQISSLLLGANPLVHSELYTDNSRDSTVPNAFIRIILTMMKFFVSVLFNRQFLQQLNRDNTNEEQEKDIRMIWNLQLSNCVQLIRNYLDLSRLPAFSPYRWLCPGKVDCFQECMIVLTFLKEYPEAMGERQLLQYLLSEVFDMFDSNIQVTGMGSGTGSSTDDEYDSEQRRKQSGKTASWLVLRQLYEEVFSEKRHSRRGGGGEEEEEDFDMESEDENAMDEDGMLHHPLELRQQRASYPLPPTPTNTVILSPQPQYAQNVSRSLNAMDRPLAQQGRRSRASTSTSTSATSGSDRDRRTQPSYLDFSHTHRVVLSQGELSGRPQHPRQNSDLRYYEQDRSHSFNRQYNASLMKEGHNPNNSTYQIPNGWIKQHPTRLSSPTNANMAARAGGFGAQTITSSSSSSSLRSSGKASAKETGTGYSSSWAATRPSMHGGSYPTMDEVADEWLDIIG